MAQCLKCDQMCYGWLLRNALHLVNRDAVCMAGQVMVTWWNDHEIPEAVSNYDTSPLLGV